MRTTCSIWKHFHTGSYSEGENVICKFCQMKQALPNATMMFKHILMCQKCLADVKEKKKKKNQKNPLWLQMSRGKSARSSPTLFQTDRKASLSCCFCVTGLSTRLAQLSPNNHMLQAAVYQKTKQNKRDSNIYICRQDDT